MKIKPHHILGLVHVGLLALIILPFLIWGETIERIAVELLQGQHTYKLFAAVSALLALDVFIPVPSSAVSVSAGMMLGAPMAFVACFIGLTLGCLIGYGFGYYFRRYHFDRWYQDKEYRQLSQQLSRYGSIVLLICRGVPILAELSVMVAGFHRFSFLKFLAVTSLGNAILAGLYSLAGDSLENMGSTYLLIATVILIPAVSYSARLWWLSRVNSSTSAS